MPSTGKERFAASFKALGATWLIAGVVFCLLVRGPGTVSAWVIWGGGVFIVGWLVVALPLIAIGDRAMRLPALVLAFGGGCAGALLMLLPSMLIRLFQPDVYWAAFSYHDLAWPGVAFPIAFVAVALYRILLFQSLRARALQPE